MTVTAKLAVSPIALAVNMVEPPELLWALMRNGSEKNDPARMLVLPGRVMSAVEVSSVTVSVDVAAGVTETVQDIVADTAISCASHESASAGGAVDGEADLVGFLLGVVGTTDGVADLGTTIREGIAKVGKAFDAWSKLSTVDFRPMLMTTAVVITMTKTPVRMAIPT